MMATYQRSASEGGLDGPPMLARRNRGTGAGLHVAHELCLTKPNFRCGRGSIAPWCKLTRKRLRPTQISNTGSL